MAGENITPSFKEALRLLAGVSVSDFIQMLKALVLDKNHQRCFDLMVMARLQDIGRSKSIRHLPSNLKMYALAKGSNGDREFYVRITNTHFAHGYEMKNESILLTEIVHCFHDGWADFKDLRADIFKESLNKPRQTRRLFRTKPDFS